MQLFENDDVFTVSTKTEFSKISTLESVFKELLFHWLSRRCGREAKTENKLSGVHFDTLIFFSACLYSIMPILLLTENQFSHKLLYKAFYSQVASHIIAF